MDNGEIAIAVSVATSIFTLYQWLITMNSRRPKVKMLRFQIGKIFLNEDYQDFCVYPKLNCILVNLSELPNAIVSMKIFFLTQGKWQEGKVTSSHDVEATFPVMIQGHSSAIPSSSSMEFSFDKYPQESDLEKLQIRVELMDQYDCLYKYRFTRKDFPNLAVAKIPTFEEKEELLGDVRHKNDKGEPVIVRALFLKDKKNPAASEIAIREYGRNGGWGGTSLACEYIKNNIEEDTEDRFLYHDLGSSDNFSKKIYIHKKGNTPHSFEIELTYGGRAESKKFALPKEFIDFFAQG